MTNAEIITVAEVAARLKVKDSWVYGHKDFLGAYKLGKYLRFSWPRVLERLEARSSLGSKTNDPEQVTQYQRPAKRWEQTRNRNS